MSDSDHDGDAKHGEKAGSSRRKMLECMTWAGTGVLWTLAGGVPYSLGLLGEARAEEAGGLTFMQISDSHIGFNKPVNPNVAGTLQEAIGRIKAILGGPAPGRINRPQRDVRQDNDRRASRSASEVISQPGQLVRTKTAHAAGLKPRDIDQGDEMHAAMVEGIPAVAFSILAVARQEGLGATLVEHVVIARNMEHRQAGFLDDLVGVVEFAVLGKLADIAGVDDEGGLDRHRTDLGDRLAVGDAGVRIDRGLGETDVNVDKLSRSCYIFI